MMKTFSILLAFLFAFTASAATTGNDESCDIAVLPAATLLLPYFEVDLDNPTDETTLFAITNVTNTDTIARVTLWTDRGYPVFSFNVYLTGYDVQSINLYDVLERGIIAPDVGTGTDIARFRGRYADRNPELDLAGCRRLPGVLEDATVALLQSALLDGRTSECDGVGNARDHHAIGYATIDVVNDCSSNGPLDRAYWTRDLRYDNVLIGDYQQLNSRQNLAQGGPLVHIRAMPEREFAHTFYERFRPPQSKRSDARQPLPAQFAARFIKETSFKIWREPRTGLDAPCAAYAADQSLAVADIVVFDEQENATSVGTKRVDLPVTSLREAHGESFPHLPNGEHSGWMYLNLDRSSGDEQASQAWVITSMRAEGRYSTDSDATAFANGCAAPVARAKKIEPANEDDSCDIALLPAATLLVPYFEVDLDDPAGETTLVTVTNVSPEERIARVTLWTDFSFPVITFNVYLTGYDVQSFNLFDVIEGGHLAPPHGTGTAVSERGARSERNRGLDLSACASLEGQLDEAWIVRMQSAFTEGTVPDFGPTAGCNNVGNEHDNAVGYATIDVVRNCSTHLPLDREYWTEDLAWDNVLIGDSHQVNPANEFAQGAPLVHIRAIPEGGTAAERLSLPRQYDAGFRRTFYSRFQARRSPQLDGRQPLPSVFAARWTQGYQANTFLKIWREGATGTDVTCATHDDNVMTLNELAVFDEGENVVADTGSRFRTIAPAMPFYFPYTLPATVNVSIADSSVFPQLGNGAIAGWVYLNLDNDYGTASHSWPSQNWVTTTMFAEGRYSVAGDAAALGNGCSAQMPRSEMTTGSEVIRPRP